MAATKGKTNCSERDDNSSTTPSQTDNNGGGANLNSIPPQNDHDGPSSSSSSPLHLLSTTTTYGLSLLWLTLCSILVVKHVHLLAVFLSFLASFFFAACLSPTTWLLFHRHDSNNNSSSAAGAAAVLSPEDRRINTRTKALVGLVTCTVSFYSLSSDSSSSSSSSSSYENVSFLSNTISTDTATAATSLSAEYLVLSLSCGYLAFDHWFSALYCQPPAKPLDATIEDAATLSLMLVALTTCSAIQLSMYRTWICTWIAYKTMRVALILGSSSSSGQQQQHVQKDLDHSQYTHSHTQHHYSSQQSIHNENTLHVNGVEKLRRGASFPEPVVSVSSSSPKKSMSKSSGSKLSYNQRHKVTTNSAAPTTYKASIDHHQPYVMVDPSLLWTIHGQTYDLAEYVQRHPGGKEAILLGRGRDCTALFESYHAFSHEHARQVLAKYAYSNAAATTTASEKEGHQLVNSKAVTAAVADGPPPSTPPPPPPRDAFYDVLCQRVAESLRLKGIDPIQQRACTSQRMLYYMLVVVLLIFMAVGHAKGSIVSSFALAICGWLLGALGHDAGHYSASRIPWINNTCVWGMSFLCNPIMWQHQHTFAHHSHTNQFHADPDLHHFTSLLRVHQQFPQASIYKNQTQFLYVVFCYTFVVFGTCFWVPIGMMQQGSLYGMLDWTDAPHQRPLRAAGMLMHLIAYVAFIIIWPFFTHLPWYKAMAAVFAHVATSGLIFAMFSQINHLNEASLMIQEDENSNHNDYLSNQKQCSEQSDSMNLKSSWAVAQVETSNNFAIDSALWHVLSNGLNLQIEHHLFPGLNHCHLHHIAPIVQATCQEYGVRYKSYETWTDVMGATLDWLHQLGSSDKHVIEGNEPIDTKQGYCTKASFFGVISPSCTY